MVPPAAPRVHHPLVWLDRPTGLEMLDEGAAKELLAQPTLPQGVMPLDPRAPALHRPMAGGDALALADLALSRGDAFDALVQYRALAASIDPAAASYLQLQSARANLALGDRDRALPLLRALAVSPDEIGWAALMELVDVINGQSGPDEALHEITPIAGPRYEQVVDHLINSCAEDEAIELLLDKAKRLERCEYAVAVLSLRPRIALTDIPVLCRWHVQQVQTAPATRDRYRLIIDFRVRLNPFVDRWDSLADAYREGSRDPSPWITFADDVLKLRPFARESEGVDRVSDIAATALVIASELAIAEPPHDPTLLLQIRERAASLAPSARERVQRHVISLLHYYLPARHADQP